MKTRNGLKDFKSIKLSTCDWDVSRPVFELCMPPGKLGAEGLKASLRSENGVSVAFDAGMSLVFHGASSVAGVSSSMAARRM
jgi:hypothetical protein